MASHVSNSLRREEIAVDGFLIDMDGTLIDSTAAVVKHWAEVAKEIGVDPALILEMSHGRRSLDVLEIVAPEKATWEFVRKIEGVIPKNHSHLTTEISGASAFLNDLASRSTLWAIVTSSTLPLVLGWQRTFNLPLPGSERLITAESVHIGKPDPTCYYLGRKRLGLSGDASEVLVIEDSPAGIRAGQEANCRVLGLLTSHTYEQIATSGPDWIVQDLESVKVLRTDGGKVIIEICNII